MKSVTKFDAVPSGPPGQNCFFDHINHCVYYVDGGDLHRKNLDDGEINKVIVHID